MTCTMSIILVNQSLNGLWDNQDDTSSGGSGWGGWGWGCNPPVQPWTYVILKWDQNNRWNARQQTSWQIHPTVWSWPYTLHVGPYAVHGSRARVEPPCFLLIGLKILMDLPFQWPSVPLHESLDPPLTRITILWCVSTPSSTLVSSVVFF